MQAAKTAEAMSAPMIVVLRTHFITANSFLRLPPAKTNARTQALTIFAAPPLMEIDFPPCPPACQLRGRERAALSMVPDSHISTGGVFSSSVRLGLAWPPGEEPALGLEPRAAPSL